MPDLNVYDIRKKCVGDLCYDETLLIDFLNSEKVKAQLGVHKKWTDCDDKVCVGIGMIAHIDFFTNLQVADRLTVEYCP